MFRTSLLSKDNDAITHSKFQEYEQLSKEMSELFAKADRNQPGDPSKAVEIILDLVRKEGIAEGKEIPFRLPLGKDAFNIFKAKIEGTGKVLEEWADVIQGTDN